MKYIVNYSAGAMQDVTEIIDWYAKKSLAAASNFLLQLKKSEKRISNNPNLFRVFKKNYKKANISRYPFSVFFKLEETTVTILAIIHFARSNKYVKSRLR